MRLFLSNEAVKAPPLMTEERGLDEPDVINLVVNLISYSIIRDEFREVVKSRV